MANCKYAHLAWGFVLKEDGELPEGVDPLLRHNGVEITDHYLNGNESQTIVIVEDSELIASTGDSPTIVNNSQLVVQEGWREKLIAFCEHTRIPFREPTWILYVYWDR